MHSSAGDLAALLDADLQYNGWDGAVAPYPGQTSRQYAMMSLRKSLIKKFHNNETSEARDKAALDLFTKVNKSCKAYHPDPDRTDELLWTAVGEAKRFLDDFCNPEGLPLLSISKIIPGMGFGRGSCIGAKSGDPYGKLAISNLTYSDPALLILFQHTSRSFPLWHEQEQFRAQRYKTSLVQGSRLSFVPKTSEISRTICTEPILNMYFQKGIARVLEERLNEVLGIDLRRQPFKNQTLARIGSTTGEFGTIDLSSASDSMSNTLVRDFFPDHIVRWLERARTSHTTLPDGTLLELHMVSSMGNAFTFPLQTLFFSSLVVAAYRVLDIPIKYPRGGSVGNFAVFGDDIAVVNKAYALVNRLLSYCGFTVNHDKSFNEGLFRESCGHDYYHGYNVRGVYVKKLLDDLDYYSAYNRLSRWSATHDMSLDSCLEFLVSKVSRRLVVPFHEDDEAGFKTCLHAVRSILTRNKRFQSWTYIAAVRKPLSVSIPLDELDSKKTRRIKRVIPGWTYNPAGILLLFLHGSIRDGRICLRSQTDTIEYRKRHSSGWDYVECAGSERTGFGDRLHFISTLHQSSM